MFLSHVYIYRRAYIEPLVRYVIAGMHYRSLSHFSYTRVAEAWAFLCGVHKENDSAPGYTRNVYTHTRGFRTCNARSLRGYYMGKVGYRRKEVSSK